ncbi:hypothetical protein [Mycobacteroides sp. CBMA 271]|nr:hypothetical protein [Mycobacteroides sp. CBMA 271]
MSGRRVPHEHRIALGARGGGRITVGEAQRLESAFARRIAEHACQLA